MAILGRTLTGMLANDTRGQQTAAQLLLDQQRAQQAVGQTQDADLARQAQELFGKSYAQLMQGGQQMPVSPQPGQPSVPEGPPGAAGAPPPGLGTPGAPAGAGGPAAAPPGPGAAPGGPVAPPMGTPGGPTGGPAPGGAPSFMSPGTAGAIQQALAAKPDTSVLPKPATSLSWEQVMQTVQQMAPNASGRMLAGVVQQYAPIIKQQQDAMWDRAKLQLQLGEQDQAHADRLLSYMQNAEARYAAAQLHSQDQQASIEQRAQASKDAIQARADAQQAHTDLMLILDRSKNDRANTAETGRNDRASARNATSIQRTQMVNDAKAALAPLPLNPADKMAMQKLMAEATQADNDYRTAIGVGNSKAAAEASARHSELVNQLQDFTDSMAEKYKKALPAAGGGAAPPPPAAAGGIPQIKNADEYNALPPGPYIDPDGKQRTKQ